ncbi:MAG: dipeptidase [Bacteroidales bacterium]|nr:dipeptidase [Bacteroidales bacterium]
MLFDRRKFIRLTSNGIILPLMGPINPFISSGKYGEITLTEEALRIHREALVLDGHNDMPGKILDKGLNSSPGFSLNEAQPQLHTDIPRLRKGGVDAQVWVAYVSPGYMRTGGGNLNCIEQIKLIHSLVNSHSDDLELATTAGEITAIAGRGKIAALVGVEGGHAIENSIRNLEHYYELGARYMTLTHNETTDWADAGYDRPRHGGLSSFGEKVVKAMNKMGMLVDVSHSSDDTVRDVLRVSKAPVIASHSSVKAICPSRRNLTNELIKGIAGTGGMVGVNFFPIFLHPEGGKIEQDYIDFSMALRSRNLTPEQFREEMDAWEKQQPPMPQCYVGHLVDHIDHIVNVAGIDHVGLGSDYDGITYGPVQMPDVSGFPYVTQELLNRGYSTGDIKKILGGNFIRVLTEAEKS